METIRIGLVEDQVLFREGIKSIIHQWDEMNIILEAGDGVTCMETLKKADPFPDVMLVDLRLPPVNGIPFDGMNVTERIRALYPDIKILILSAHDDEKYIAHLIELGAHGYLVKSTTPDEVRQAILCVYRNGFYLNSGVMQAIQKGLAKKIKPAALPTDDVLLTNREKEILELVCRQMTDAEIAEKLFISIKTVNNHRASLLDKIGARNTAGIVVFALKHNLVDV